MKRILFLFSLLLSPFFLLAQAQERPLMPHEIEMMGRDTVSPNERFLHPHERIQMRWSEELGLPGRMGRDYQGAPSRQYLPSLPIPTPSLPSGLLQNPQPIASSTDSVLEAWVARYNGPGNGDDIAIALAVDASGNVYVTGVEEYDFYDVTGYYATIKYDASGSEQWVARYNGPGGGLDIANALAVDGSGNVYVTGYSAGSGTSYDYATIKYDASGAEQWVVRYNGPGNIGDFAHALAVDEDGNVYVTGSSEGSGTNYDYATIKYDASGAEQWVARYNGPGSNADYAHALAVDAQGNVSVTGYSWGSGTNYDYATIKYDASGGEQWVARYNGPGRNADYARALALDADGSVCVTGYSWGSGANWDYATIKYDASGAEQWVSRYNGPGNGSDYTYDLAVDGGGNVYVTGSSEGSGTNYDCATIKYDALGVEVWVARYNVPENGSYGAGALAVDETGNVYVTGGSWSGTSTDYATIKYSQSGGTAEPPLVSVVATISPASGDGTFDYTIDLTNNTDSSQTIDIWTEVVDPRGARRIAQVVYGRTLLGDSSFSKTTTKQLGDHAVLGEYALVAYVGTYPDEVIDSSSVIYTRTSLEKGSLTEGKEIPGEFELSANYPNPFNPSTTIRYGLPEKAHVKLELFNMLGQSVAILIDGEQAAGYHSAVFEARAIASGVYVYRLRADSFVQTKRFLLLK